MDPFSIAALISMVGGAVMQQQAQEQAARRQQREIQASLERQRAFQREAEQAAMSKAMEFAPQDRQEKQQQIEQQITTQMMEPVRQFAAANEAPPVQGDVSDAYLTARAKSQAEQMKAAEALARIFGKTQGAQQLRQNEAIGMLGTGAAIDRLRSFSQGTHAADQIGINAAGVPDGGQVLAGTIMQGLGSVGLSQSLGDLFKTTGGDVWSGAAPVAQTNNVGLTGKGFLGFSGNGGLGLRL